MSRRCSICTHPGRLAIDEALVRGEANRALAARYTLSEAAVRRHKAQHLPRTLVKAKAAEEVAEADDLLAQIQRLQAITLGILGRAAQAGDLKTVLAAVREARGNVELLARLMVAALQLEQSRPTESDLRSLTTEELMEKIGGAVVEGLELAFHTGDPGILEQACEEFERHGYEIIKRP